MFTLYSPPTNTSTLVVGQLLPPTETSNPFTQEALAQAPPPFGPGRRPIQCATTTAVAPLGAELMATQHIQGFIRVLAETRMETD